MRFEDYFIRDEAKIRAHARKLARNAADADDLVQESALKAIRNWHRFNGDSFSGWFAVLMRRMWFSNRRSYRRDNALRAAQEVRDTQNAGPTTIQIAEVMSVVKSFSEPRREIFALVEIAGHTHVEVAEKLGLPLGTVQTNVWRAKQKLLEQLAA